MRDRHSTRMLSGGWAPPGGAGAPSMWHKHVPQAVRNRVERVFARRNIWKFLRDCRLKGDGIHFAMLPIARPPGLALAGQATGGSAPTSPAPVRRSVTGQPAAAVPPGLGTGNARVVALLAQLGVVALTGC